MKRSVKFSQVSTASSAEHASPAAPAAPQHSSRCRCIGSSTAVGAAGEACLADVAVDI